MKKHRIYILDLLSIIGIRSVSVLLFCGDLQTKLSSQSIFIIIKITIMIILYSSM